MKRCPFCAEEIQDYAIKCKHCGERLNSHSTDTLDKAVTIPSHGKHSTSYDTLDVAATEGRDSTILAGQYRIVKKIGEGGMGIVYLAEDTEMANRKVAIKVLPPLLSRNTRAVENLRKEAITAISLNHPNIIRLYGFHSDGDIKFLVMEYIDGVTLEEKIFNSPSRKLTLDETIKIAGQTAIALDYAHTRKPSVFHRDLKPSNIMISDDGTVKLLDFGIAREMKDSYTRVTGQDTSGTLPYMSPQQLMGARPDASMDIYSLGAVLYECFSGHTPFYTGDLRRQIEIKRPDDIAALPAEINNALQKALAKEPNERPKTAGQLIELLKSKPKPRVQPVIEKPPVVEEPEKPKKPEPVTVKVAEKSEPVKSKKGLWIALIIAVIGIISVIALFNQPSNRSSRKSTSPRVPQRSQPEVYRQPQSPPAPTVTTRTGSKSNAGDVITNSIGMKLIYIPAGEFMMGSPSNEQNRSNDESPQHRVKISKGFYMGIYEVTQAQYQSVVGTNPSNFKGDNLPVEQVSWNDATEFCRKLSQKEGKTYRLPTEAEWEYACRAGITTAYQWGNQWQKGVCNAENDVGSSEDSNVEIFRKRGLPVDSTVPVGSFAPNGFGLYDMHGNVWEWCQDWYDSNFYSNSPSVDPEGPNTGTARVLRGGSWYDHPRLCRSALRYGLVPVIRNDDYGFRVVVLDF